jgi:hypothetical protein
VVKSGIYHNSGGQFSSLNAWAVTTTANQTDDRAAFLGELGFTGSHRLTDGLAMQAGYSLIWIESVVLASDQIPATNFVDRNGVDSGGGVFYHGATVGLTFSY